MLKEKSTTPSAPPPPAAPPPDWYCLLATAALFLLPVTRLPIPAGGEAPLFSLGEWLLIPLAGLSLSMGLLPAARPGSLLPPWLDAVLPGLLWLAAAGAALLLSGAAEGSADLLLAWGVRLLAPTFVFLPLLAVPLWRGRLFWAIAISLTVNAALVFLQTRTAGLPAGDPGLLALGGMTAGQFAYGVFIAVALPLLAAWRGGGAAAVGRNRSLFTMLFTFLLPALALSAGFTVMALAGAGAGLVLSWAAWRRSAWITGVFVCLLLFGAGGGERRQNEEAARRGLLAASGEIDSLAYARAAAAFRVNPYLGEGAAAFAGDAAAASGRAAAPWYASLLAGTGVLGLGMWATLLAELAARGTGRNGVPGAAAALAVCGLWADIMAAGVGGLVGFVLVLSAAPEYEGGLKAESRPAARRVTSDDAV